MIPTALEKDAFPALASALTFETKSTQKSTFSRKERSDDCFYSVQRGVPQTAPSYELFRKYPRYCRVTRCRLEFLGSHRSLICSIGDVFGGCSRFCVFSRKKWKNSKSDFCFRFSRKFALKNSEKAYGVGVRFSLEIRKRVWKWFEAGR